MFLVNYLAALVKEEHWTISWGIMFSMVFGFLQILTRSGGNESWRLHRPRYVKLDTKNQLIKNLKKNRRLADPDLSDQKNRHCFEIRTHTLKVFPEKSEKNRKNNQKKQFRNRKHVKQPLFRHFPFQMKKKYHGRDNRHNRHSRLDGFLQFVLGFCWN